jgi:Clp amino terminal domain, pathogenicity island component
MGETAVPALLRLGDGLAWEVLSELGVDLERAQSAVADAAVPWVEEGR